MNPSNPDYIPMTGLPYTGVNLSLYIFIGILVLVIGFILYLNSRGN